jgi:hypothetical protein
MVLLAVLGILDLVIGALLIISPGGGLAGNGIVFIFAILALLKGLYSVLAAAGAGFFFDVMGWLDLIAGFFLLLANWGFAYGFFLYVGIIMVLKAFYSIVVGLIGSQD